MARIGFIGLGLMGNGMARNLLKAGHTVTVFNRTRARADALAVEGAQVADTPAQAAQGAEFIISMVADDRASREIWTGEQGALSTTQEGAILIESSTLTPDWITELARDASTRGGELLDAPVTGSKAQAEAGELVFLVGGNADALERARPILETMGKTIHYLGETGRGAMMKLINNQVASLAVVGLAEGMALAERSGMNMEQVAQLLMAGPPGSPIVKRKMPAFLSHKHDVAFSLQWMHKDLTYAIEEGQAWGVPLPLTAAARELMAMALVRGWGEQDYTVIAELLRGSKSG